MRILAISGSLRAGSYNTALARAAAELAPDGVEIEVYDGLGLVPHYDEDLDQEGIETPATVAELRRRIDEADALLLVTPEYNGSTTGVLKNAIDWVSARHRGSWLRNKTVAVAGATTGEYGAIWAQQDLRRILGIAGARVVAGDFPLPRAYEAFDESGTLASPLVAERLRSHLAALVHEASPLSRSPRRTPRGRAMAAPRNGYQRWISRGASGTCLPRETTHSANREPPTLARRFPVVPGARLYPLVPPLPVLSSLKPDHLLSAVMPAYALRADGGRAEIRSTIRAASSSLSNVAGGVR